MLNLHLPQRLAPISKSFEGIDRMALLVLALALASGALIVAAFTYLV